MAKREKEYLCEVFYDLRREIDQKGVFHIQQKQAIYRAKNPSARIVSFSVCKDHQEPGVTRIFQLGFNSLECAQEFIRRCPAGIRGLMVLGGALCYAQPELTYQISIKQESSNSTELIKALLYFLHDGWYLNKNMIEDICSLLELSGIDQFWKQRLYNAYAVGAIKGLFTQSPIFPRDLADNLANEAKHLHFSKDDALNIGLTCKAAANGGKSEYEKEKEKISGSGTKICG